MSKKSTRERLLKFHAQAQNDLERCLRNLKAMYDIYDPDYLSNCTQLENISRVVITLQELLEKFKIELM